MSVDSVVSITWDALKSYVFVPIKRRFGYVISSKSFADHLQEEARNLENETQRVRILADVARNNLRNFHDGFMEWQESADKALEEAGGLLGDVGKASKTCCYGTLPDPKCRYQLSRKAEGKIEVIKQLAQKCSGFKELNDISGSAPAPGNVTGPTLARTAPTPASVLTELRDDGVFESRAAIIRDIIDALADNRNSVVGVHGMGGVGKSTLLGDVKRRIKEEKSYDWVAKADVSENPDIKRIQEEIADALGLSDIKNKESVSGRAEFLQQRLEYEEREKKKVLIILDNLWKGLDLKSVGIPCGHDNKVIGCKLLLTSRDRDVLKSEMGCDKDFPLGELKKEEAKRLFEGLVGEKVHDDDFTPLVDEALHKCAGLPFLIVNMAKYFEHASLSGWRDALYQIEKCTNEGLSAKINKLLQVSYNHLESEDAKSLLQLCVACAVSEPSFENLLRYGFGLGIFQKDSGMEQARDRLSTLISNLQASSLLLGNRGVDGFKIHDLVRDFVAQFILRDHPLLALKDKEKWVTELPKDKLKRCRAICFPYANMKKLPQELDCPELHIFLLLSNNKSLEVPHSLFYSMRKLMVLNLNGIRLTCSPLLPFRFLENLHALCLDGCSLDDVAILGYLKGLQILSFANSNIHRLPKEIGQLGELRLLDLNRCLELGIIEPGVLGHLFKLEELYMKNSFDRWNFVDQTIPTNAELIELNHMKNLCTLHVSIPNPRMLPEDLDVDKLTKHEIQIGNVWHCLSECKGSRTLELELGPLGDVLRKGCIQSILGKTNNLFMDKLDTNEQSICALSQNGFPELKHLHVENSPSVHYILQQHSLPAFRTLELICLKNLVNLEKICQTHISSKSFSTLKVVRVEGCDKMEVLFPLSLMREISHLEEIRVVECNLMREIVEVDDCGYVELHNLWVLELCDLPNIKNFITAGMDPLSGTSDDQVGTQLAFFSGQQVVLFSLETLVIKGMDNIEKIWDNQFAGNSFEHLRSLCVCGCNKLVNLVPSYILQWLLGLESLEAGDCDLLEVVFELQTLNPLYGHPIALPLKELKVSTLPKLKSVWDKELHRQVKFQCLRSISVSGCKSLTSLFPASVAKDLIQLEKLEINGCGIVELIENEEEIVPRFDFPKLTSLKLEHSTELKCIYTGTHALHWPALKTMEVHGCNKVEIFASQPENEKSLHKHPLFLIEKVAFPNLETLHITGMDNIEMIWDDQVAANSFPNLKSLCIQECIKIKCIWDKELHRQVIFQHLRSISIFRCKSLTSLCPASIARDLIQLKELEINACGIVELIEKDGLVLRFVFPNLTSLKLEDLIELKCIYAGTLALHWPALKILELHGCNKVKILASQPKNEMPLHKQPLFLMEKDGFPSLETLCITHMDNIEIIWDNFQHLKTLDVSHCNGLSYMFTPTITENLVELVELRISNCEMLTEVISDEGGKKEHEGASDERKNMELDWLTRLECFTQKEGQGSTMETIRFPNLLRVELECLPKLNSFLSGNNHTLEWPKLEELTIANCPKMKRIQMLFPGPPSFVSRLCTDT